MSEPCPACGGSPFQELIDFGPVPASGVFLSDPNQAAPVRHLRFEFCTGCGLIRQWPLPTAVPDYTHVSRPTARQLPAYAGDIISRLRDSMDSPDGLIMEVGANDGTFLNVLARSGFSRRLGIEPSRTLSAQCEHSGHAVVNLHLDEQSAHSLRATHGAAAAIICRHTLEHVPSPAALLRAMAVMLDEGGTLFLEVPDTDAVVGELRGFELWDEHLFYFSISNLRQLLPACGFVVESAEVVSHRGSRNIACWARRAWTSTATPSVHDSATLVRQCAEFGGRWSDFRQPLQEQSRAWSTPVIAMGASHPQSNFLHFAGIGNVVSGLLDEDPEKIGRWVALPQATPIFHPQELESRLGNGTLLLTAFGYEAWTGQMKTKFRDRRATLVSLFEEVF